MENSENNINQTTEEIVETHEQQPVAEPREEASFELLCEQAAKRRGNPVGDGREEVPEHEQDRDDHDGPQQIVQPL